jgi:hypothetical protein
VGDQQSRFEGLIFVRSAEADLTGNEGMRKSEPDSRSGFDRNSQNEADSHPRYIQNLDLQRFQSSFNTHGGEGRCTGNTRMLTPVSSVS